jgi:hypothetical protein
MPRTARIVIPNYPHHIIQRGHNRQAVFAGEDDYLYYLDNLAEWKQRLKCKVYAFCLMTNHVHLVVDPGDGPESLGRLMKRQPVGRPASSTGWKGAAARSGKGVSSRVPSNPMPTFWPAAGTWK